MRETPGKGTVTEGPGAAPGARCQTAEMRHSQRSAVAASSQSTEGSKPV